MPDITDQRLRDLLRRLPDVPDDLVWRAVQAEDKIRKALAGPEPDSRAARNIALQFLQAELTNRRKAGLISTSLIEVQLAGTTLAIGIEIHNWTPDRPAGPWPPGGGQLTDVFFRNLTATLEGDQQ